MNWFLLPPGSASRVGVITTRRLGNAPVRSRARRLMREAFRARQHCLARPADVVLVARASIVGCAFQVVERDFVAALKKAGLLQERGL
jgi:ribonuclease P protein component